MSRTRRIIEAEVAASTLVIHKDDRSTDFLKAIYEGLGYTVITGNVSEKELLVQIERYPRVFMLGHGSPSGLFGAGYIIGDRFGPALAKKKDGLYIWCNADACAKRWGLSGLVSGMFISEVGEAAMFGIRAMQEEVDASNAAFSKAVRNMLDTGAPPSTVRDCYKHATCKITKFNNERLYVFDNGTPTPALHPTSMAHPREPLRYSRMAWPEPDPQPELAMGQEPAGEPEDVAGDTWWEEFEDLCFKEGFPIWTLDDDADKHNQLLDYYDAGLSPAEALDKLW